jgi:glucokinase
MILAVDIGGTNFSLALVSQEGQIQRKLTRSTDRSAGAAWMIDRILEEGRSLLGGSSVSGCGISFGGPVDFDSQTIINSTHVSGWDAVKLPELIEKELGIPALVDNDANAGALGEFVFGAGNGSRNLVYYNIGTGIGGGIIIDGRIYRGSDGNAGELGHVPILPDGPLCDCGNRGCLEALCSGTAIGRRANEAVNRQPRRGKGIREAASGDVTAKSVFDAARKGDRLALDIVNEICLYLGMGIATSMNAFAPDCIVVGGSVSKAGKIFFRPLREQADRFLMPVHRPHLKVVPARLGNRSGLIGAAALVMEAQLGV